MLLLTTAVTCTCCWILLLTTTVTYICYWVLLLTNTVTYTLLLLTTTVAYFFFFFFLLNTARPLLTTTVMYTCVPEYCYWLLPLCAAIHNPSIDFRPGGLPRTCLYPRWLRDAIAPQTSVFRPVHDRKGSWDWPSIASNQTACYYCCCYHGYKEITYLPTTSITTVLQPLLISTVWSRTY